MIMITTKKIYKRVNKGSYIKTHTQVTNVCIPFVCKSYDKELMLKGLFVSFNTTNVN